MKKWWHVRMGSRGIPGAVRYSCLGISAGLLLAAGCFPQNNLQDDRNPFYLMGLRLRQENKHQEAAEAFEKCLRLSPASAKADLQLAMLCEDRLGDPVRAIYHYRAYLKKAPKGEHAEMVRKWLARGERTFLKQLMDRYPEDVDILMGKTGFTGGGVSALSPREAYFVRRIKELSAENLRLQGTVSQMSAKLSQFEPPVSTIPGVASSGLSQVSVTEASALTSPKPGIPPTSSRSEVAPQSENDEGPLIDPEEGEGIQPAVALPGVTAGNVVPPVNLQGDRARITAVEPGGAHVPAGSGVSGMKPAATGTPVGAIAPVAGGRNFIPLKRLTPGSSPVAPSAPVIARIYTVQKGDTLSGIARKFYGRSTAWRDILETNRKVLPTEAALKPGLKLTLPSPVGATTKERCQP